MSLLGIIKSEDLMNELTARIEDQLHDPEPQYDGVLSFLSRDELDTLCSELMLAMSRARSLAASARKDGN